MTEYPMQKFVYLVWVNFQVRFVCSSYSEASKRLDLYGKNHFGMKDIQKVKFYG